MPQDEWSIKLKGLDATLEYCKQQITICGILIGLTITLNTNLVPKVSIGSRVILIISWGFLFVSVMFGLLLFGRASYALFDENKSLEQRLEALRIFGLGQICFLILGIIFLGIAVIPHMGG